MERRNEKKVTACYKNYPTFAANISVFPGVLRQEAEIIPAKPDQGNACAGSYLNSPAISVNLNV